MPVPSPVRRRLLRALLATTLPVLLLGLAAPPADAGHRHRAARSWIAYSSDRDSVDQADDATINDDLYLVDPRSRRTVRLTTTAAAEQVPVISPDGTQLLFQSNRSTEAFPNPDKYWTLYSCRLHLDTARPRCGRAHPVPGWTPNGLPLPFLTWVPGNESILYAADGTIYRFDLRSGAAPVPLVGPAAGDPDAVSRPSLSRDGQVLAWTSNGDLWRARPDGTARVQLTRTPSPVIEGGPEIPPDGTRIAFTSNRRTAPALDFDIWVMDAVPESAANVPVDLTGDLVPPPFVPCADDTKTAETLPIQERFPTWSPDGRQIAFYWYNDEGVSQGSGYNQGEVYRVDADGGRLQNLTRNYLPDLSRCDPAQIGDIQPDWGGVARHS